MASELQKETYRIRMELEFDIKNEYDLPRILWHYTDINGLMGIIRSQEKSCLHFWFTRSDCLNDSSEGSEILRLFQECCNEWRDTNRISQELFEILGNIKIPETCTGSFYFAKPEKYDTDSIDLSKFEDLSPIDVYICSFSKKPDALDLWRYYSKGTGGYCIGINNNMQFPFIQREKDVYADSTSFDPYLASFMVIYDNPTKREIIFSFLDTICNFYNNFQNNDCIEAIIKLTEIFLQKYQFQFKHECFSSEEEFRLIFKMPKYVSVSDKQPLPEIRYRPQNGIMVPYLDLDWENAKFYLNSIWISPFIKSEKDKVRDILKEYLAQCGFECNIYNSTLPVRY